MFNSQYNDILGVDEMSRPIAISDLTRADNARAKLKLLAAIESPLQVHLKEVASELDAATTDRDNSRASLDSLAALLLPSILPKILDQVLPLLTKALDNPSTREESRFSDTLGRIISADIDEATRYLINEDSARQFLRDELEGEPRYFTRAVESAVKASIDTDDIASTAKDRVLEDLDLDDLNIEDKINEVLDNRGGRDSDLDDEDIDRIATRVCKVIRLEPQNKSFM